MIHRSHRSLLRGVLGCAWAAPNSLLGLALGLLVVLSGGRMHWRQGALEIGGGALAGLAARLAPPFSFCAVTLGHVILALDEATLERVRAHEQVHVRQYERWGPLFLPAYLLSSLAQLVRGRRPYRDNHFEREAYAREAEILAAAGRAWRRS